MRYMILPLAGLALFVLAWMAWPAPINPPSWTAPQMRPESEAGFRADLDTAMVRTVALNRDADSFSNGSDGLIYLGTHSGDIVRFDPNTDRSTPLYESLIVDFGEPILDVVCMGPTHLAFATRDAVYVYDKNERAYQRVSMGVTSLPHGVISNVEASPDGTLYFIDSNRRIGQDQTVYTPALDALENRPWGALYAWSPQTGRTELIHDRLHSPSGLALSQDGRSIYVSEPNRFTVREVYLDEARRGQSRVVTDTLPGTPAALHIVGDDQLVVTLEAGRNAWVVRANRHPWLARMMSKLPSGLRPEGNTAQSAILLYDTRQDLYVGEIRPDIADNRALTDIHADTSGRLWTMDRKRRELIELQARDVEAYFSPNIRFSGQPAAISAARP
ncbi:SMP-30/gluconolactonase/LRE family protein [Maricaulis sp. D1M11]